MPTDHYDILLIDDEPEITACLSEALSGAQMACTCVNSATEAVNLIRARGFDAVLTDLVMPEMDGLAVLQEARRIRPRMPGILLSGRLTAETDRSARREGAYDVIAKPFDLAQLRDVIQNACAGVESAVQAAVSAEGRLEPVDLLDDGNAPAQEQIIGSLLAALRAKDVFTEHHSVRTAHYTRILARLAGLPDEQVQLGRSAALVHDVGKMGVPDAILTKPGKLTVEEFAVIRRHSQMGRDILAGAPCMREVLGPVLHHHEWWDGSGYPSGLTGESIPLISRLIHVADAIDAMRARRSYGRSFSSGEVVAEIECGLGLQFDPMIGAVAIRWIRENPAAVVLSYAQAAESVRVPASSCPAGA